jgi:hypothetical protein
MKRHDILILAIRIGSLWLIYVAISMVTGAVLIGTAAGMTLVFMLIVALVGLSVIAWKFSDAFALKLLPESVPSAPVTGWRRDDAQDMLLRVLGVFFLTSATAKVVHIWVQGAADLAHAGAANATKLGIKADLAQQAVYILVGLGLVLGRERLAYLWEKVWSLSGNQPEQVEEPEEIESSQAVTEDRASEPERT